MLNNHGFDIWSNSYDSAVAASDENNKYPFAGYSQLMNAIYGTVMSKRPAKVLDIGFGTALLTSKLYDGGNDITGIDFSPEMIKIAKEKMPQANLIKWDFTKGIPDALSNQKFDFIISTYALHHLTEGEKGPFIINLLSFLKPQGRILIGDVCFLTRDGLNSCKEISGDAWDDDEVYFVFSELEERLRKICKLSFHEYSFCSGIMEIQNT